MAFVNPGVKRGRYGIQRFVSGRAVRSLRGEEFVARGLAISEVGDGE